MDASGEGEKGMRHFTQVEVDGETRRYKFNSVTVQALARFKDDHDDSCRMCAHGRMVGYDSYRYIPGQSVSEEMWLKFGMITDDPNYDIDVRDRWDDKP